MRVIAALLPGPLVLCCGDGDHARGLCCWGSGTVGTEMGGGGGRFGLQRSAAGLMRNIALGGSASIGVCEKGDFGKFLGRAVGWSVGGLLVVQGSTGR